MFTDAEGKMRFVKLKNGEEFVAFVERVDNLNMYVSNPMVAQVVRSQESISGTSVTFVPWVAFSFNRENMPIPKDEIMILSKTQPELAAAYSKATGKVIGVEPTITTSQRLDG